MAPVKSKGESKSKCGQSCCKDEQSTSVFLLNDDGEVDGLEMVKLKHPGTEKPAYFLFNKSNTKVYELFTFTDNYRSYFIDSVVKSDGSLYLTTPVDPLFLTLPYLISSIHCSPIDQLLRDDVFPDAEKLCSMVEKTLHLVSDKKGTSVIGYKYNEEKTLNWLENKVKRIILALKQQSIQVSAGNTVVSNNFIKHSEESYNANEHYLKCSFGIISEYLSSDLKEKLQKRLNISFESEEKNISCKRNRSASCDNSSDSKKSKITSDKENEDMSPPRTNQETSKSKTPVVSAKEKARAKAAVGSKSISSFFAKKTST